MKKRIWIAFLLALILCGCGEERYEKVNFDNAATFPIEEVEQIPEFDLTFQPSGAYTEDGVFFLTYEEDSTEKTIYFADSITNEIYPLCAKTNCGHNDAECPARLDASSLHYDGEYLYMIEGSSSSGQCIMRQRPDGSDREVLFQQEAQKNGTASIHSTLYHGDTLYFTTFGSVFDPESGELTSGEQICIGNLKTGEMKVVPMEFGEGSGTTLLILGVHGNELLLERQTGGDGFSGEQTYRKKYFLLNLDTYNITVIAEFTLDDKCAWYMVGDSLLLFVLDSRNAETLMEHKTEGSLVRQTADMMVTDLKTGKAYLKKDVVQTNFKLSDDFYIYYEWNEDYTSFTKMVKDLKTGEIRPYPENMPRLIGPVRAGKHLYAEIKDENGEWDYVRILEEDFWAGNPDFYIFPEWTENRWY